MRLSYHGQEKLDNFEANSFKKQKEHKMFLP